MIYFKARLAQVSEMQISATKFQALYRGNAVRVKNKREEAASVTVQSAFRGHSSRKETKSLKKEHDEKLAKEREAAERKQAAEKELAATAIQSVARKRSARKSVAAKREEREKEKKRELEKEKRESDAAKEKKSKEQEAKEVEEKKEKREEEMSQATPADTSTAETVPGAVDGNGEKAEEAASKIQAVHRGNVGREKAMQIRKEAEAAVLEITNAAATRIQAQARGRAARVQVDSQRALIREKLSRSAAGQPMKRSKRVKRKS